jgi:hypothetical protein
MIQIDGSDWPIPCSVERAANVTPSEISGLMLDRTYFNDVIGTFMEYDIQLAVPTTMQADYSALYEVLTAPVDGHSFVFPYGQTTIEVTARVSNVKDTLVYVTSAKQYWRGVRFTATANHPSKALELGEVVSRGRSPMPEVIGIPIGSVYELTETGWQEYEEEGYDDADGKYY